MNISQANRIFRSSIIAGFFKPELVRRDYRRSESRHPVIPDSGMMQTNLLHIFFDIDTGADYQDGDEWLVVEYLFPRDIRIPDSLKGPDHFTTIPAGDGSILWHHREMVRYKYGRSKKLSDALDYIDAKYRDLHTLLAVLPDID